jgi:glycosyltransferase involved in cell wall biosynthesis|tara:strand:+ start:928 stop:2619 length:1692 start_codon:yes stop_codon:yes gene_type:complete
VKTVLFHSNSSKAFTGFGKNAKNILRYLYKTKKYKIVEFANGATWDHPALQNRPWETQGTLPSNPAILEQLQHNPEAQRDASYGGMTIDQAISKYKPDVYIGVEDIWGFNGYWKRKWWNKTNCMIWTTLDSLPILPTAIEAAPDIKNYYVWASFAEKEMHKLGHKNVKTLPGALDTSTFFRLSDDDRVRLRAQNNLSNEFIIGFVFRNQLRKSVPNLLDGFQIFKKENPESKAKLLLHTHWSEGWDIPRLLKEKNINPNDILTTYVCKDCKNYEVKPFVGESQDCKFCGSKKSVNTTNISCGVDESQLNEVYNLMDVYCHPFTSGGMEIPIFEAKLTELPTLVTNYSCGEDSCTPESGGFELDWAEYREPGTQFIKASTSANSIARQLKKVYKLKKDKLKLIGSKAREFTIKNYSIESVGKRLEKIIDDMPDVNWDFKFEDDGQKLKSLEDLLDPGDRIAIVIPQSDTDVLFINSMIDNLKSLYPKHDIYMFVDDKFTSYADDHPSVHKVLPYKPELDNLLFLEGRFEHKGYFDCAFVPHVGTQKFHNYQHNGKDKTQFKLYT